MKPAMTRCGEEGLGRGRSMFEEVYVFSIFKHLAIFSLICKGFKESLGNRVGRKKMRNIGWG